MGGKAARRETSADPAHAGRADRTRFQTTTGTRSPSVNRVASSKLHQPHQPTRTILGASFEYTACTWECWSRMVLMCTVFATKGDSSAGTAPLSAAAAAPRPTPPPPPRAATVAVVAVATAAVVALHAAPRSCSCFPSNRSFSFDAPLVVLVLLLLLEVVLALRETGEGAGAGRDVSTRVPAIRWLAVAA
jgi:hypothetical protein